jgi:hypothetical protein
MMRKAHKEKNNKDDIIYVQPRDWKEYLGESLLIVFSVLLALFLTEALNKQHERHNTKNLLKNVSIELRRNKQAIFEMQDYNMKVLNKIDSVLKNRAIQRSLISNNEFHLNIIAPEGVQYRYLENDAWTIAKSNNIISKIDIKSISILTRIYEDSERIMKLENEVAKVVFDRASRDPKQVHTTLIIIRDIYHGWAVDRVPGLISRIDTALIKIEKYQEKKIEN